MISRSALLIQLATEVFLSDSLKTLQQVATTRPFDRRRLIEFDDSLWGPSISRIANNRSNAPGTLGIPHHSITRCEVEDRDVFKPLHYCAVYLTNPDDAEWFARGVVEMSSLHLEALVKRIGRLSFLPLGNALRRNIVREKLEPVTWDRLWRYRAIYNDAKHLFDHDLGTHLFSVQDAVLAYLVARRLAQGLYPLAHLRTDWRFAN